MSGNSKSSLQVKPGPKKGAKRPRSCSHHEDEEAGKGGRKQQKKPNKKLQDNEEDMDQSAMLKNDKQKKIRGGQDTQLAKDQQKNKRRSQQNKEEDDTNPTGLDNCQQKKRRSRQNKEEEDTNPTGLDNDEQKKPWSRQKKKEDNTESTGLDNAKKQKKGAGVTAEQKRQQLADQNQVLIKAVAKTFPDLQPARGCTAKILGSRFGPNCLQYISALKLQLLSFTTCMLYICIIVVSSWSYSCYIYNSIYIHKCTWQ